MDTLTHALSGALLARATAPAAGTPGRMSMRQRMALGALAAALPDADVVASYVSPLSYLYHHRGATHSLLMLPLWAAVLALLSVWLSRRARPQHVPWGPAWREYAALFALGIGTHIAGDLITSFGTMILAPLSDTRFEWSTTFIIDLWFSGIIVAGLAAAAIWRKTRIPAVAATCVLAGYVGFQYLLQQRAIDFGVRYALAAGLGDYRVSALPRPVSPFNWMVVVREPERYHYALVNVARKHALELPAAAGFFTRLSAPYLPLAQAVWLQAPMFGSAQREQSLAREVWSEPGFGFFRWFAAYPALYRVDESGRAYCTWFEDLRFFTPGRPVVPFRYGMCREAGGRWQPFQLLPTGERTPVF